MKIIMDSLVPNHKKKQLMPERIMEPPDGRTERYIMQSSGLTPSTHEEVKQARSRPCFYALTQHGQASNFVHEKRRHDVPRQHSKGPQEIDEVNPVGTVVVVKRHLATRLVVGERAVDHLCAAY